SARSAETDEGCWKKRGAKKSKDFNRLHLRGSDPSNTPHPTELRSATRGEGEAPKIAVAPYRGL
ncbi:hypothetical protein, partial [Mesorhizobium sp. STM 4661]|uniref:hypothetical protein n=1 Tax=Mesorhizobium sp. STM 4661 TaxID=1297570 RepID=UPI001AEBB1F3